MREERNSTGPDPSKKLDREQVKLKVQKNELAERWRRCHRMAILAMSADEK
jgi:hypothetical protein